MKKLIKALLAFLCLAHFATAQNDVITIIGPPSICEGDCAQLSVSGSPTIGTPLTYFWSNGGTTNPITVCAGGLYGVTVTNANGASYIDTFVLAVKPNVPIQILSTNANLCPDTVALCERVCPNTTVTYYLSYSGNPGGSTGSQWSVFGSTDFSISPDGRSVSVTWGQPGNGSVSVVTGAQTGCIGEASLCVTVIDEPVAAFGTQPNAVADTLSVCAGQLVFFENQSQYADIVQWYFGDDNSVSSQVNPQHVFDNPGAFEVTLVALSACSCSDTTKLLVKVLPTDPAALDCIGTLCPGEVVTYSATTSCPISNWSVTNGVILGGGSPGVDTITIQWNNGPTGLVQYELQPCSGSSCPLPIVFSVPVLDDLPEISGPETVCADERSVYSIQAYGGTEYNWTLSGGGTITEGQGTNIITVQWGSNANPNLTRWISVEYANCYLGCGGQDSIGVRILPSFVINGPVDVCAGNSANFTAKRVPTGGNQSCFWRLRDASGNVVWNAPVASATVAVPFTSGPGLYRLFAEPDDPTQVCNTQAQWTIVVSDLPARPTAIAGPTMICPNTAFTYEATGLPVGARILWTVRDGPGAPNTIVGNPINITWTSSGPYSLTAVQVSTDGQNCPSDTAFLSVMEVMPLPISGIDRHCTEVVGYFEVKKIPNITYNWSIVPADAGEFQGGLGSNGIRIYWQKPGPASVVLEVCGHVSTFPINVYDRPVPQLTIPAGVCPGATDTAKLDIDYFRSFWYDDNELLLDDTSFLVVGPGSYVVFLEDFNGCKANQEFTVAEFPVPNLSLSTADPTGFCNNSLTVTMQALTGVQGNYTYEWFQDGVALGVNANTYSTNQYSQFTVQATNAEGCTATAGPITLFSYCGGPPVAFPSQGPSCPPGSVGLAIDATPRCDTFGFEVVPGPLYVPGSATWTTGISGGAVLSVLNGDKTGQTFPNAGIYMVVMQAQLTNGATCTLLDSVRVEVVARFDAAPACAETATPFEDISSILPGVSINNWDWDFGDPGSGAANQSLLQNPAHIFPLNPSAFSVTFTAMAQSGCISTFQDSVYIPGPTPFPIGGVYPRCADLATPFPAGGSLQIAEIVWDFGNPTSGVNNAAVGTLVYHRFDVPGTYTVVATATNVFGCVSQTSVDVDISPNDLSGIITPNAPAPICEGQSITLQAPPGSFYGWSTNEPTQSIQVNASGTYTVMVSNAFGCTLIPPPVAVNVIDRPDEVIKALQTNSLGQIIGTITSPLTVCEGENVTLRAFGTGPYTYVWSNSITGATNIFSETRNNLLTTGTYTYTVVATDPLTGCTSESAPFVVVVNPRPDDILIGASGNCAGQANTLSYTGPTQPDWVFNWNTGISGTTLVTEQPGQYFLRVSNALGCATESNRLSVFPAPPVQTLPDGCLTQCKPDTLCVPNLPDIVSWQWYLNGVLLPGSNQPELIPEFSGDYYAVLTDTRGCTAQSSPVNLTVLDGFGQIFGQVWSDVNQNGVIDPADTLISNIPVLLLNNGVAVDTTASNTIGNFVFPNIVANTYTTALNTALLPAGFQVVIGQDTAALVGCDANASVAHLVVFSVCPPLSSTLNASACSGDSYDYFGTPVPAGATQVFTYQTAQGCDSLVTVQVATRFPSAAVLDTSACTGSMFTYAGVDIAAGQSGIVTLNNAVGCDSLVTVNVATRPSSTAVLDTGACAGRVFNYAGINIPAGQTQAVVLTNFAGCDSSVTVQVASWPVGNSVLSASACQGSAYSYNGVSVPAGSSQVFTLATTRGCDSLVTVNVSATLPAMTQLSVRICPGSTYPYAGVNLPAGETTAVTVTGPNGCDSIVTVSVDTFTNLVSLLNVSACSDSTYSHFGVPVAAGNTQLFQYTTSAGCDSVVTVVVDALPLRVDTVYAAACTGDFYNHFGIDVLAGNTVNFQYNTFQGCDSTVTVVVEELLPTTGALNPVVCFGDSFLYQGIMILPGSSAVFALNNAVGCDSTLVISVSALPPLSSLFEASVCPNDSFAYAGLFLLPGSSTDVVLSSTEGCDSTVTVLVSAWPETTFSLAATPPCPSGADGNITIENLSGGTPPWLYALNGGTLQDSLFFENLGAGAYTVAVEDASGCTSTMDTTLAVRASLQIELKDGILACDSNYVLLEPVFLGDTTNLSWLWYDGSTLPFNTVALPGPVWVEVSNICEVVRDAALVRLEPLSTEQGLLYAPNVFHPEGNEALNQLFRVFFPSGATVVRFKLEVYDRWGNLVFLTEDFSNGWNGYMQGKLMDPAVFVWHVDAAIDFCGRMLEIDRYGDITIVR
jgi:hypothetical protein